MNIPENLKVIIGIGNPDPEYKGTYHNIGLDAVDNIARALTGGNIPWKHQGKIFSYLKSGNLTIAKSLVFMNDSGTAALKAMSFMKSKPESLLIIHDDSDIVVGSYKLVFGRGSAGHHGVESIIKTLKTQDFWRLRIGVRSSKTAKAGEFVLKKIKPSDRTAIYGALGGFTTKLIEKVKPPAAGRISVSGRSTL